MLVCFLILTELWDFLLSFVFWSFQVLGKDLMDHGTKSGKSLCLGMPMAPQGKIQGQPKAQAWGCPGRHPLFSSNSIDNFTWSYIFIHHMICVLLGASCMILSLFFLVYHNRPCCTHLLGETHMNQNLLEYSLCFTYIFWAR